MSRQCLKHYKTYGPPPSSLPPPPFLPFLLECPEPNLLSFLSTNTTNFLQLSNPLLEPCRENRHQSLSLLLALFLFLVDHMMEGGGASANESKAEAEAEAVTELELGLGLSLGGVGGGGKVKGSSAWGEAGRILTAKDFPSRSHNRANNHNKNGGANATSTSTSVAVSGTKRAADSSVAHEGGSPTAGSQVVGWPPIRAYRMNSLVNQAKAPRAEEDKAINEKEKSKDGLKKNTCNGNKTNSNGAEKGHLGFVKVNMDGVPIGRKVDLNAHACYETLAQTLEDMFFRSTPTINSVGGEKQQAAKSPKLLDGSSEYVLTYEDKEGDWMLVGDVPWRMFLSSVRRLRIMKTSEANGIAPRFQERNDRQRSKPV